MLLLPPGFSSGTSDITSSVCTNVYFVRNIHIIDWHSTQLFWERQRAVAVYPCEWIFNNSQNERVSVFFEPSCCLKQTTRSARSACMRSAGTRFQREREKDAPVVSGISLHVKLTWGEPVPLYPVYRLSNVITLCIGLRVSQPRCTCEFAFLGHCSSLRTTWCGKPGKGLAQQTPNPFLCWAMKPPPVLCTQFDDVKERI